MAKAKKDHEAAFDAAMASGDLEAIEALFPLLLKKKAKSIFRAIEQADVRLTEKLVKAGASLEVRHFGGTPLLMAVFELTDIDNVAGFDDKKAKLAAIVKILVQHGADRHARASDGTSVLELAAFLKDKSIYDFISAYEGSP